jgi:hypothetical protein
MCNEKIVTNLNLSLSTFLTVQTYKNKFKIKTVEKYISKIEKYFYKIREKSATVSRRPPLPGRILRRACAAHASSATTPSRTMEMTTPLRKSGSEGSESSGGSGAGAGAGAVGGWVYHLGVNSIGHEYCHLRFLLIRGKYVEMYKRDPSENPGIVRETHLFSFSLFLLEFFFFFFFFFPQFYVFGIFSSLFDC